MDASISDPGLSRLLSRRSVPALRLAAPGPNAKELETILTIAARVPDHGRLVPWRFLIIAGEAQSKLGATIASAFQEDNPSADEEKIAFERNRLSRAPLVIAVVSRVVPHPKIPEWEQVLSAGSVCLNLLHAAAGFGYGATWLTEWLAFDRRILDALGLDPHERIAGFVHIGTASEIPTDRPRPELSDIVTYL